MWSWTEADMEHRNPIISGFFVPECEVLHCLNSNKFIIKVFSVNLFDELELDIETLNLGPVEEEVESCIRPEKNAKWERLQSKD